MLHRHLYAHVSVSANSWHAEKSLTFSGIAGVYGYETEFEPPRDRAARRDKRFVGSIEGSAPTLSIPNLLRDQYHARLIRQQHTTRAYTRDAVTRQ